MFFMLLDEDGDYIQTATGKRKNLLEGTSFSTPKGLNYGCIEFDTVEEAMELFGLERIENNLV